MEVEASVEPEIVADIQEIQSSSSNSQDTNSNITPSISEQPNASASNRGLSLFLFFGIIILQTINAGNIIISKKALSLGMHPPIYALYRNMLASILLWASILCTRSLPPVWPSLKTWGLIIILALLEPCLDQNMLYAGAKRTPASFSAFLSGISPAITFALAHLLRYKIVDFGQRSNKIKAMGALIMCIGASIMFYRKKYISFSSSTTSAAAITEHLQDWAEGPLLILAAVLSNIFYNLLMGTTTAAYPYPLTIVACVSLLGSVVDAVVALIFWQHERYFWLVKKDWIFLAYVYGGLIVSSFSFWLSGTLIKMRSAVFVSSFSPLSMMLVMFVGLCALGERVYTGSIISICIILIGVIVFSAAMNIDKLITQKFRRK